MVREVERKKVGLRKARRRPQFSKRLENRRRPQERPVPEGVLGVFFADLDRGVKRMVRAQLKKAASGKVIFLSCERWVLAL